jgi:hypothetical protein
MEIESVYSIVIVMISYCINLILGMLAIVCLFLSISFSLSVSAFNDRTIAATTTWILSKWQKKNSLT